jgi:hypothetical protein
MQNALRTGMYPKRWFAQQGARRTHAASIAGEMKGMHDPESMA